MRISDWSSDVCSSDLIGSNSPLIWALYNSPTLNRILRAIAREEVLPCPDISEELFMARQERKGDTHGLHWGDYSFAQIWILQAPPIEVGGLLQIGRAHV